MELSNIRRIFATEIIIINMNREEALKRFKAAKQKKMNAVADLEKKMKQAYEERTGLKAKYVVSL